MLQFLQQLAKIEKPEQNLREETLKKVRESAARAGLEIAERPDGFFLKGRGNAIVVVQFGGRRDFYEAMEALEKDDSDYRVIVTSSNVKSMKIGEIKWILNNKFATKKKWLILDIERRESPKTVNFMLYGEKKEEREARPKKEPRRKKIYGKPGEHKEQD
ncbi:MAG: hypothetical protein WC488_04115 [Candidatus Micrarchaeia archaeon]